MIFTRSYNMNQSKKKGDKIIPFASKMKLLGENHVLCPLPKLCMTAGDIRYGYEWVTNFRLLGFGVRSLSAGQLLVLYYSSRNSYTAVLCLGFLILGSIFVESMYRVPVLLVGRFL